MRKVIAVANMTINGVYDHTEGLPSAELHQHYTDLLENADVILFGRRTYQLMQYWQTVLANPVNDRAVYSFALAIDRVQKIVFSHTIKDTGWASAKLASQPLDDLVSELRRQSGKDILIGSRSLIVQLMNLNLIDEYRLCIHPVVTGNGGLLFDRVKNRTILKLSGTKILSSGAIVLYYEPVVNEK